MKLANIEVSYIDHCGSDLSTVNSARVSFDKRSDWQASGSINDYDGVVYQANHNQLHEADAKLIKYLAKHKHKSPFNHSFITVKVKAPIFVARQLVKHKFMPINEVSRRYVTDEPEFYFPERWRKASASQKQGSSDEEILVDVINGKYKRSEGSAHQRRNPCHVKFARLSHRVKAAGDVFDLDINDVEWNEVCPILDIHLNYDVSRGGIFDDTPTFDKVYPDKGYVKGNVRVISDLANRMKSSANPEQLEKFARSTLLEWKGEVGVGQSPQGHTEGCLNEYNRLLGLGVCGEQARAVLPQNMMTEWYWSGTLGAFADMLNLRLSSYTQKETRDVAEQIRDIVLPLFPVSLQALIDNA